MPAWLQELSVVTRSTPLSLRGDSSWAFLLSPGPGSGRPQQGPPIPPTSFARKGKRTASTREEKLGGGNRKS